MTMTTTTTAPTVAGAGDRADADAFNADALNTPAAYRAATAGAAVYESKAGRLKLTGADARDLLNRLSTNLVDPNAPAGEVTATVLTSDRGRIVDLVYVAHCGDHQALLTGAGQQDNVTAFLDKYTIMEDIEVERHYRQHGTAGADRAGGRRPSSAPLRAAWRMTGRGSSLCPATRKAKVQARTGRRATGYWRRRRRAARRCSGCRRPAPLPSAPPPPKPSALLAAGRDTAPKWAMLTIRWKPG